MVNGTGVIAAENHRLTARNLPVAPQPRALFVNHSSVISGAELILLDTVIPWAGASAFLFEAGPLQPALADRGLHTIMARWGAGLSGVRRDSNLLAALPLAGRLLGVAAELASVARGFDVLYANSQKAFVLAAFAARWARVPLIWHLHDIIDDAHFGAAQRRLQIGLANNWTWRVIVPSQAAASAFVAAGGHADRVQIVVNGLDISPDPPSPSRAALGLPEGKLFGVFSRLAPWKGQHVALDALAQIPDASCVIVGSALFHEDAYEARLRAQAAQPGLAGRVHFLPSRSAARWSRRCGSGRRSSRAIPVPRPKSSTAVIPARWCPRETRLRLPPPFAACWTGRTTVSAPGPKPGPAPCMASPLCRQPSAMSSANQSSFNQPGPHDRLDPAVGAVGGAGLAAGGGAAGGPGGDRPLARQRGASAVRARMWRGRRPRLASKCGGAPAILPDPVRLRAVIAPGRRFVGRL